MRKYQDSKYCDFLKEVVDESSFNPCSFDNCLIELAAMRQSPKLCERIKIESICGYGREEMYKNCLSGIFSSERSMPYLGVYFVLINKEVKDYYDLPVDYGAFIKQDPTVEKPVITPGGPADKAGLKENDIILEFNGERITEENSLTEFVRSRNIGDEINLKILREREVIFVKVILEAYSSNT